MAHANKTYVSNGQSVGITSLIPDGDAAPPTTGLKLSGTVAHGNVVTITSGSDVDFGSVGSELMIIYRMENMTAGSNLTLTRGSTFDDGEYMCRKKRLSYTTANQMPVHTANGMIQLVSATEGAASCRVMIANTPTPTKDVVNLSCCVPVYWSSHLIQVEIVEGIFWNQSLSGKYLHIYGAFNEFKGAVIIP